MQNHAMKDQKATAILKIVNIMQKVTHLGHN